MSFKVGDKVLGQFSEDDIWYHAVINSINNCKYHVTYTEYQNSEEIGEERLRHIFEKGDKVMGQFTEDDIWYEAQVDDHNQDYTTYDVTYTEYSNKETLPFTRVRKCDSKTLEYQVGDEVMGQFTEDDIWYDAVILSITKNGNYLVKYTEYENEEEIPVERIRPKGSSTASATSETLTSSSFTSSEFTPSSDFAQSSSGFTASESAPPREQKPPSKTLFVAGISFKTSEEGLKKYFSAFGDVEVVSIAKDKETGKPRGFGYVDYKDVETATKVLKEVNGNELDGRNLRLDFSVKSAATSTRHNNSSGPRRRDGGGADFGGNASGGGFGGSSNSGFGGSSNGGFGGSSNGGFGADSQQKKFILEEDDPVVHVQRKVTSQDGSVLISRSFTGRLFSK